MKASGPILVIDDDEDIRDFVSAALVDEGYEVVTAADGIAALEQLRKQQPSLILLDVLMPEMDGWDFLSARSEMPGPHVPVIALTAMRNVADSLRRAGIDAFLAKPFELDELLALVAAHAAPTGTTQSG